MTAHYPYGPRGATGWRWLSNIVWGLERAFERARAADRLEDDTRVRIFFVLAMFATGFLVLGGAATRSALFPGEESRGHAWGAVGARADLVDRQGRLLAADLTFYKLYVDPVEVWDKAQTRKAMAPYLNAKGRQRLDRILRGHKREFLIGSLSPGRRKEIHDLVLPGLTFEEQEQRFYPLGETAAHLIGYTDRGETRQGIAGAERALEQQIVGGAENGGQVPLSIDLRVQSALEDEVKKAAVAFQVQGAVGVVTNVRTGEILGLASYPTFDLNAASTTPEGYKKNRAAAQVFEMGSTFKAFTVAIGLDTGVATPSTTFDARVPFKLGYRTIHDFHSTRSVLSLVDVFIHSSNIGTAKLAVGVGAPTLHRYFDGLGLTKTAEVELMESARPLTPKVWDEDAVASTSFGHGMNVTPLALARAYGAVLNGGQLIPLTIRRRDPGAPPPQGTRVFSEATSRTMLQIMRANVVRGTGGKADAPGLRVGGKTGTGEKYDPEIRRYNGKKQVSSFAAVFPADGGFEQDRYFVLILMDEPKGNAETFGFSTGGWVAAPAAGRVIDRIAPFLGVPRKEEILTAISGGAAAEADPGAGM